MKIFSFVFLYVFHAKILCAQIKSASTFPIVNSKILQAYETSNDAMRRYLDEDKKEAAWLVCSSFNTFSIRDSTALFYESYLMANYLYACNQADSALLCAKKARTYARDFLYHSQIALANNYISVLLLNQKKTDGILSILEESTEHANATQDSMQIAKTLDVYELYHTKIGSKTAETIRFTLKALDIALAIHPTKERDLMIAELYSDLSSRYATLNYQDKSLEYGVKAYTMIKEIGANRMLIRIIRNLYFNSLLTTEQKVALCKEGIEISKRCGWFEYIQSFSYNTAVFYAMLKNMDSCTLYYYTAKEMRYKVNGSGAKNDLSNARFDAMVKVEPDSALVLLQQFEKDASIEQRNSGSWRKRFFYRKATCYAAVKQYDSAYYHYANYKKESDSIQNKENVETTERLRLELETARKESEIQLLAKQNEIQALDIQTKNILAAKQALENLKQHQKLLIQDLELENKNKSLAISEEEKQKKQNELMLVSKDIELKKSRLQFLEQEKNTLALLSKQRMQQVASKQQQERKNLLFGAFLLVGATSFAFLFHRAKQRGKIEKEKLQVMLVSKEEERNRIAAEMHDDIGATLSSLQLYSELIKNNIVSKPEKSLQMVDKMAVQSKELMVHMGDIIWSMKRVHEGNYTLASKFAQYGSELLSPKNIHLELHISDGVDEATQHPLYRKNLLLFVKEFFNNVSKYSNASEVILSISKNESLLFVQLEDNGIGFDEKEITRGNGLRNMQERIRQLVGEYRLVTSKGNGCKMICRIPIARIS
jgi:signal transduction histidine kinase